MPLTGEVQRSPEPSARLSAAVDSEEWQTCTTNDVLIRGERWIVLMFSPIVREVQRQRCWKRGTCSGDGQRLSLYDYGTPELSFNAVERRGSTLPWTVCTASDSEERQICTLCLFAKSFGLWKDADGRFMLFPIVEHTSVWEGVGGRGEIWRGSPQWNVKDQLPKPQTPTVATAQWPKSSSTYRRTGWKNCKHWANIEKGIKLIPKTIGNRKGHCAWSCSRWQTKPEKICKLQCTNEYTFGVNDTELCFAIFRFSQVVLVASNNFTHNLLFYFQ